jgi:dimethylamine monooxygenase subunit C
MRHTSVPRWPTSDPGVDHTGRAYAVMSFGPAASRIAAGWRREVRELGRPVWTYRGESATEPVLSALRGQLATATVGWRLMVAGPQADVLRVHGEARLGGALDSEVVVVVTDDAHRRVWCSHCGATSGADVATGEVLDCAGCGRSLLVYHHVSRRAAAYLGFMVDAEELA